MKGDDAVVEADTVCVFGLVFVAHPLPVPDAVGDVEAVADGLGVAVLIPTVAECEEETVAVLEIEPEDLVEDETVGVFVLVDDGVEVPVVLLVALTVFVTEVVALFELVLVPHAEAVVVELPELVAVVDAVTHPVSDGVDVAVVLVVALEVELVVLEPETLVVTVRVPVGEDVDEPLFVVVTVEVRQFDALAEGLDDDENVAVDDDDSVLVADNVPDTQ